MLLMRCGVALRRSFNSPTWIWDLRDIGEGDDSGCDMGIRGIMQPLQGTNGRQDIGQSILRRCTAMNEKSDP